VPALRATQREELLIVTCPCCQFGVETLRQLPRLTAHVVYLADEFRILLDYEIGHGWPSYASQMACESSGVLNNRARALLVAAPIGLVPLVAVAAFWKKRGFFASAINSSISRRVSVKAEFWDSIKANPA